MMEFLPLSFLGVFCAKIAKQNIINFSNLLGFILLIGNQSSYSGGQLSSGYSGGYSSQGNMGGYNDYSECYL